MKFKRTWRMWLRAARQWSLLIDCRPSLTAIRSWCWKVRYIYHVTTVPSLTLCRWCHHRARHARGVARHGRWISPLVDHAVTEVSYSFAWYSFFVLTSPQRERTRAKATSCQERRRVSSFTRSEVPARLSRTPRPRSQSHVNQIVKFTLENKQKN